MQENIILTNNIPNYNMGTPKSYISPEQFQREIDYNQSLKIITKMMANGFLSEIEFYKIDLLNRESFMPMLAPIMPRSPCYINSLEVSCDINGVVA